MSTVDTFLAQLRLKLEDTSYTVRDLVSVLGADASELCTEFSFQTPELECKVNRGVTHTITFQLEMTCTREVFVEKIKALRRALKTEKRIQSKRIVYQRNLLECFQIWREESDDIETTPGVCAETLESNSCVRVRN